MISPLPSISTSLQGRFPKKPPRCKAYTDESASTSPHPDIENYFRTPKFMQKKVSNEKQYIQNSQSFKNKSRIN